MKQTYRVRPGFVFGVQRLGPGSIVELTPQEAGGFLDKLELVEQSPYVQIVTVSSPVMPVAVEPAGDEPSVPAEGEHPRRRRKTAE